MPSLGMMTINALVAADSVIIPCEPSFLSVKGLDLLLRANSKAERLIFFRIIATKQCNLTIVLKKDKNEEVLCNSMYGRKTHSEEWVFEALR